MHDRNTLASLHPSTRHTNLCWVHQPADGEQRERGKEPKREKTEMLRRGRGGCGGRGITLQAPRWRAMKAAAEVAGGPLASSTANVCKSG